MPKAVPGPSAGLLGPLVTSVVPRLRQMRLIACITEGTQIRKILNHIGVDSEPPHEAPARATAVGWLCARYMPRTAHHAPEHQTLVVTPASGAAMA